MSDTDSAKRTFLNQRDWGSYLRALPSATPLLVEAVKSGRAWFTESASQASHWLTGSDELGDELSRVV